MHPNDLDDDVSADLAGQYLKQSDFDDDGRTFVIVRVEKKHFEPKNGQPADPDKWTLFFEGDRCHGLNKTNLALMVKFYGKHHRAWVGKPITVYKDESVSYGGRLVGGLRLRRPSKQDIKALMPAGKTGRKTDDQESEADDAPF